jgi:WD40 repeat protein
MLAALAIHAPTAQAQEKATLSGHTHFVWSVSWSPDGKTLASASADGTVRLWDPATGKEKATFNEKANLSKLSRDVHAVAFSPDGNTLAVESAHYAVNLRDPATGKE